MEKRLRASIPEDSWEDVRKIFQGSEDEIYLKEREEAYYFFNIQS